MESLGNFHFGYNEDLEPVATNEEIAVYSREFNEELEEEEMLTQRFSKMISINEWCCCSKCSLDKSTKKEECFCCHDIHRCTDKFASLEEDMCITDHPGYKSVCLDTWVLEAAAIGLRTRKGRSYTVLREKGLTTDSQFFRSVAYRQFFRLIWEYHGTSKRLPLPCCVYNSIRSEFPSEDGFCKGFLEEDTQETEEEEDESETEHDDNL